MLKRKWLLSLAVLPACDLAAPPEPPTSLGHPVRSLAVAHNHTVAVSETGATNLGGEVSEGGQPLPDPVDSNGTKLALNIPASQQVAVGKRHACVISVTNTVHCWGDQSVGELGSARACTPPAMEGGPIDCKLPAAQIVNLPPMRAIAAGDDVTCAITMDDHVICWGQVGSRLGGALLPPIDPPRPVQLAGGAPLLVERVVIQAGNVCAIDKAQTAWCWGDGFGEQPVKQPYTGVLDLAIGRTHTCVIASDGLSCWGENRNGESGDIAAAHACGNTSCNVGVTHIDLDATRVAVGERHSCALTTNGDVMCWGSNEVGQLGHDDAFLLGDIGLALDGAIDVVAGYSHTCARTRDGNGWCWGSTGIIDPH